MRKQITKWIIIISLISVFFSTMPMLLAKASQGEIPAPIDPEDLARARDATVRIVLLQDEVSSSSVEPSEEGQARRFNAYAAQVGLGTLVESQGDIYMLTHDHWLDLNEVLKAQIHTASGVLVSQVDGASFQSWIRHTDKGTMVLLLPSGLLAVSGLKPVQYNKGKSISIDDTVLIARKKPHEPEKIEFIPALVESDTWWKGIPAYYLRSMNGEYLVHGDSGGGVWHRGEFVGNSWMTYHKMVWNLQSLKTGAKSKQYTGMSLAAQPPESIQKIFSLSMMVQ